MARLADGKVRVPVKNLRKGDLIEYAMGGFRCGKIEHIHPRARKLRVGRLNKCDLPKRWRSLADYKKTVKGTDGNLKLVRYKPTGTTIHESQVTGILVGRLGKRVTLRPGNMEYDMFMQRREDETS